MTKDVLYLKKSENILLDILFENRDIQYQAFQSRLIPNIEPEKIIGVRTPVLRKIAKGFSKTPESKEFLQSLPHKYYEEDNVHGAIISDMKDFDEVIESLNNFLPYVDNWATCDLMSPKIFKKNTEKLLPHIHRWIKSSHTYTVRFAIEMLMSFYLGENYDDSYGQLVASVKSEEYYINMMIAWYFATALAKNYEEVLPYLQEKRLEKWTHNKTIQKAVESYRITKEQKEFLKTLKIK